MLTTLEEILNTLNIHRGVAVSMITLYDHFKNQNDTHINEIFNAIRDKSKDAYELYIEYRKYREKDLGVPLIEDILGYGESCNKDALKLKK